MFLSFSNFSASLRIVTVLVALSAAAVLGDVGVSQQPLEPQQEQEEQALSQDAEPDSKVPQTTSRYPAVVLERDANFSIPNASAKPSASTESVTAQPFLPKEIYQRTAQPILAATELIADGFGRSVVTVLHEEDRVALGTVVALNGQVLTKHSLVQDIPDDEIRFQANGLTWQGTLIGFDEKNDMALFQLHSGDEWPGNVLRPISFTTDGQLRNGKLVIGIGAASKSLSVGMTTAAPAPARKTDCETCIDMGLTIDASLTLKRVYPRTVGERLGMLVGDRILMVNQQRISTVAQYQKIEKQIQVGDLVTIAYRRNGQAFVISDKVPSITKTSKQDRWGGGPFSQRRSGFDSVLVHDSVIDPIDCGGPLVNLQGQFCGINIARSMRVCSLALPAKSVKEFVLRYVNEAELIIERR